MKRRWLPTLALGVLFAATSQAQIYLTVIDSVYGNYSAVTDVGGVLNWRSADYGWTGDISLVNPQGYIIADVVTSNDYFTLYTFGSGFYKLGNYCSTETSSACLTYTGEPLALYSTISSLNGGQGICCGNSNIILSDTPLPEPGSVSLMGLGVLGMLGAARRKGLLKR